MRSAPIAEDTAVAASPRDQADGLRRLFASTRQRIVPLAANPHGEPPAAVLERLCGAFSACGASTLVVDAAHGAPAPSDLAWIDLGACVEAVSPDTGYLAARGLPMRHLDSRGSTAGFLDALAMAAPRYDVVLLHAGATDLARLLGRDVAGRAAMQPLLLADESPESITHAYASLKLLATRCDLALFDLVVAARRNPRLAERAAGVLARCAEDFVGAMVRDVVAVDTTAVTAASPALRRLAARQLMPETVGPDTVDWPPAAAARTH
jgi:hypothetical protein